MDAYRRPCTDRFAKVTGIALLDTVVALQATTLQTGTHIGLKEPAVRLPVPYAPLAAPGDGIVMAVSPLHGSELWNLTLVTGNQADNRLFQT